MFKNTLSLIFSLLVLSAAAQKKNDNFNYFIKKTTEKITIDGKADEAVWSRIQVASDFFQVLPMDTSKSKVKTEVMFTYDDKNLYLLFINHNYIKGTNVVESMKRDFSFSKNDNDLLFFDTFNDLTNGYSFGSNARGGQWDGLMSNGSSINLGWENKWQSEVSFDEDKWIWEAAIPFKTLRYKSDITKWGVNFSRLDLKTNEKSSWTPVPRQFPTSSLAFTGNLVWDSPPPSPGKNISFIPYVGGRVSKNIEKNLATKNNFNAGFDAKIGITSALNLDLTVNPDFSQVEVDVQQTNLDRFELFFPERRQFFIENGDIFNNFGSSGLRPFFSRRIGLNAPIIFGAKISGKLDENWRIGGMNIQTGVSHDNKPASNFSVLSVQRKVFKRSFVSAIYVDRETTIFNKSDSLQKINAYNRTIGLEYNLASADNKWNGKIFGIKTFNPFIKKDNNAFAINIQRSLKNYSAELTLESVDDQIAGNEVGFIRRRNYNHIRPEFSYLFFPKGGNILSHGPRGMSSSYFSKNKNEFIENTNFISYGFTFRKQATMSIWTSTDYVVLQNKFDPTNFSNAYLGADTSHSWRAWGTSFSSRPQSLFTYSFSSRYGGYYADGKRLNLQAEMGYRFQPYVAVSLNGNFNRINFFEDGRLPQSLKNTTHDLWLIGPRIDMTLSNKIFFTNFIQYNNQQNNVNLNARFQWRYSPASDLFIVYTDNYTADNFQIRNRAIVLKFTYWWNV